MLLSGSCPSVRHVRVLYPDGQRYHQTLFSARLPHHSSFFQSNAFKKIEGNYFHLLVAAHGLVLHQYADDCQIYIATPANETSSAVERLTRCLNYVNAWLSASRLRLNPAKTQILWIGSKHLISDIVVTQVPVLASSVTVADSARDLGVVIDSCLTMADHVSVRLLSTAPAAYCRPISHSRRSQDDCACFRCM